MRIAMLSWESLHSVAVGGVAAHVTELSASLARRGCDVHVFTRMAPGQKYHDLIDGVHYHRCPYIYSPNFVDDVNNMCRAFVERLFTVEDMVGHFDVVHAHDWLASNALIWTKHGRPHPGVLTVHATEYARCGNAFHNGQSHRIRDQERAGTYWADRVIAVSSATRDELRWMYEVPDEKSHVVYNGVSPHRFTQPVQVDELRQRYDIGPMDPTVLFSGRLVWQKGPDLLMEAIGPLLRHRSNAKFVFVGDGEMRGQLEARAHQLGVAHAVRFLGRMDNNDMPELYHMADLVCVPSRNEPFGIVVLEAWSAGKPVVVTQVGGPKEYVWHNVNGLGIQPTPDSVGWGIGTIFANFEHARWLGANGRRAVEDRFTWDRIAGETLAVYAQALGKQSVGELLGVPAQTQPAAEEPAAAQLHAAPEPEPVTATAEAALAALEAGDEELLVRASLSFGAGNGEVKAGIAACQQLLTEFGLEPKKRGRTIRVKGDWLRVTRAIEKCCRDVGIDGAAPVTAKLWPCCPAGKIKPSVTPQPNEANDYQPLRETASPGWRSDASEARMGRTRTAGLTQGPRRT